MMPRMQQAVDCSGFWEPISQALFLCSRRCWEGGGAQSVRKWLQAVASNLDLNHSPPGYKELRGWFSCFQGLQAGPNLLRSLKFQMAFFLLSSGLQKLWVQKEINSSSESERGQWSLRGGGVRALMEVSQQRPGWHRRCPVLLLLWGQQSGLGMEPNLPWFPASGSQGAKQDVGPWERKRSPRKPVCKGCELWWDFPVPQAEQEASCQGSGWSRFSGQLPCGPGEALYLLPQRYPSWSRKPGWHLLTLGALNKIKWVQRLMKRTKRCSTDSKMILSSGVWASSNKATQPSGPPHTPSASYRALNGLCCLK